MWSQRIYRFALAGWHLFGHGFPKLASWLFDLETWGPHLHYIPRSTFSILAATIEFVCPLFIILGIKIKWNAILVGAMLLMASFLLPYPWLHIRVQVEGYSVPFAIIPSRELSIVNALAFLSLLFFAQDEKIWKRR
jgi:uncharacterized membrane protein YphA (DoxX/SURF4 family)